jgi:hypothetical protein
VIAMSAVQTATSLPESYFRRAFLLQYNLILLGGSLLFSLAQASPRPVLTGLLLEIAWLGIGSNLGFVRRWLDRRVLEPASAELTAAPVSTRPALEPAYAGRAATFEQTVGEMRGLASVLDGPSRRHLNAGLDALVRSFARLCLSHQRLSKYVASTPEAAVRDEIARLKSDFSAEKDLGLRLAIRQSMALAQRRLEQREQVENAMRTANLKLVALERAAVSLAAQARAVGPNRQLLAEVDALRHEAGTDSSVQEVAPLPE